MTDDSLEQLAQLRGVEHRTAIATLIATQGTPPRTTGATMCVGEGGRILGSVTIGGCVDGKVIEVAERVLRQGIPERLSLALGDEDAWELGMTCAGTVDVIIEPVEIDDNEDPVVRAHGVIAEAIRQGRTTVEILPLSGSPMRLVVGDDGVYSGTLGDPLLDQAALVRAAAFFADGRSRTDSVSGASGLRELFFDVHRARSSLIVVGATHLAMPLVELAHLLGFATTVIDGRERFATRERFPHADAIRVGMPSEEVAALPMTRTTSVVLVSHDYKYDLPVLRTVLATEAGYVGLLGSRRRGKAILEFLAAEGMSAEQLRRVRVPVGLDIGARSGAEIALSVLAEAIAVREGRSGGTLRDAPTPATHDAHMAAERPSLSRSSG
jgi:xanthine dehydrogenase accessory factor